MAFAPGMHVFPGGRLDPRDAAPGVAARSALTDAEAVARLAETLDPPAALAFFAAAVREAFEEVGLLLADPVGPAVDADAARPSCRPRISTDSTGPVLLLWSV